MNTEHIQSRLNALTIERCGYDLIGSLYGIQRNQNDQLFARYWAWARRLGLEHPTDDATISRHSFEMYLQSNRMVPLRIAGVRLGMDVESLTCVLEQLSAKTLISDPTQQTYKDVVDEHFLRDFYANFNDLRLRLFSDHNSYCRALHEAIRQELGCVVVPLHCVTSAALGETPPDYAHDFDCISDAPIGLRYQAWLDTKKPMSLRPDACGLLLYVQQEALLKPHLMHGDEPHQLDPKNAGGLRAKLTALLA